MRWFEELKDPSLKCARIGHNMKERNLSGYCLPDKVGGLEGLMARLNRVVAFRIRVKTTLCSRCNYEETAENRTIEECLPIHSLGLPALRWETLQRTGFSFDRG